MVGYIYVVLFKKKKLVVNLTLSLHFCLRALAGFFNLFIVAFDINAAT